MSMRNAFATVFLGVSLSTTAFSAATITIINADGPGEGFNDPTPVAQIGGNTGMTLGQQRLNVFQAAANLWGATLTSAVEIRVSAQFNPQTCTATSAVLGSAGPTSITANFTNAPVLNTWYHRALADKIRGFDGNAGQADINAQFNSNLGSNGSVAPGAGCGFSFYLGLDNNHGALTDLFSVVLHELAHGLGFSTSTSTTTGAFNTGLPHIWDTFLFDATAGNTWVNLTAAQRQASAINNSKLVWTGPITNADAAGVLTGGTAELAVSTPANISGIYAAAGAVGGGGVLTFPGVTADLMPAIDGAGVSINDACEPITGANAAAIAGKVAIADRGSCGFVVKATNVQAAGAVGLILANNAAGAPPPVPGGITPAITIPVLQITQADGQMLRNQLLFRSRRASGITVTLRQNTAVKLGLDPQGRVRMNAPNPVQPGSSVSHFDPIATPNLIMEPAINPDLLHQVTTPFDLTFSLLKDIGW